MQNQDSFAIFDEPQGRTQYCIADILQRCPTVTTAAELGAIIRMSSRETKRLLHIMADSPHVSPFIRARCQTICEESDGRKTIVLKTRRYDFASASFSDDAAPPSLYIRERELELFDAQAREGAPQGRESKNSEPVMREGRSAKVTHTPSDIVAQAWKGTGLSVKHHRAALDKHMQGWTEEAIRDVAIRFAADSNARNRARNPVSVFVKSFSVYRDQATAGFEVGAWALDYRRKEGGKGKKGKRNTAPEMHDTEQPQEQPQEQRKTRRRIGENEIAQLGAWKRCLIAMFAEEKNEVLEDMPSDCAFVSDDGHGGLSVKNTRLSYADECAAIFVKHDVSITDDRGQEHVSRTDLAIYLEKEMAQAEQAAGGIE